jgi:hypothetical protein
MFIRSCIPAGKIRVQVPTISIEPLPEDYESEEESQVRNREKEDGRESSSAISAASMSSPAGKMMSKMYAVMVGNRIAVEPLPEQHFSQLLKPALGHTEYQAFLNIDSLTRLSCFLRFLF